MIWRLIRFAVVACLISVSACTHRTSTGRSGSTGPIAPSAPEDIRVTLGWSEEQVLVPAAAPYPDWVQQMKGYARWRRIGCIQSFETVDDKGNKVVANLLGVEQRADGSLHDLVGSVATFRQNGTLRAVTQCLGLPDSKYRTVVVYDETGSRRTMEITVCRTPSPATGSNSYHPQWRVWGVTQYKADGAQVWWDVNESGVVIAEAEVAPDGQRHELHRSQP